MTCGHLLESWLKFLFSVIITDVINFCLFTIRVRSTREGNIFSLLFSLQGGTLASSPRFFLGAGGTSLVLSKVLPGKGGTHPSQDRGTPGQESECCFETGGTPLAVTQEDFLLI